MDTNPNIFTAHTESALADARSLPAIARIIEFYEEASADYEHWSRGFNMHIGFLRRAADVFDREKMLEQLNFEVAARLDIDSRDKPFLIDLGCGFGAVSRTIAKNYPNARIKGVTLSHSQVEAARKLNARENLETQIEILRGDFTDLAFENASADGVFAVESACYAKGAGKEDLIREVSRVLKPGARFVVADCFVKNPEKKFGPLMMKLYSEMCKNWAVPEMPTLEYFTAALKKHGFRDIMIEDISWRAAPSVAHAPFAVFSFILKKFLARKRLERQSINNLKASLLAPIVSLNRSKLGYYLIIGRRGGFPQ